MSNVIRLALAGALVALVGACAQPVQEEFVIMDQQPVAAERPIRKF
ncbi:MAG: hypothetical protein JJU40_03180 [Rhodobacteraceae bacterium]|jgi:hypothetical protein|nr:hypothetical protein [Paracoccaceae bacterium]